jgi:all-trans-8'-apo-beta-carotenal 15,15'-oxygenase
MIGRETFSEAIQWRPERGGVLVVAHRDRDEVTNIDTPACWMWHSINASEEGDVLLLDFIGGELGGGLGTSDSPLFQVMRGEKPESIGELTNFPRRYRVNIRSGTVDEQIIDRSANFELPNISATERSLPYTFAYTIRARRGELFANGLSRIDGHTLDTEYFEFGPGEYCGEPVVLDQIDGRRGRYVVSQVYRAADRTSYYAVFDEAEFVHGPVARIYLRHHAPLSFHGFWSQKQGSDPI